MSRRMKLGANDELVEATITLLDGTARHLVIKFTTLPDGAIELASYQDPFDLPIGAVLDTPGFTLRRMQ